MKKLLFIIIAMVFCLAISGQQINQSNNRYRNYDVLEKKQVTVKGFDLNSKKCVWSLEDAELSEGTYKAEYSTETDTLVAVERGDRTYYSQDRNTVDIIGSENFMELISYDMPERWLQFPMQVGDSVCGFFNGSGPYCERFFIRRYGTYKTKADAAGTLVLPKGDSLRNVIRLHTERYVGTITVPIDTMEKKIPAFTVDSIIRHLAPDTAKVREDIYRWYAEGYRYPILEAKSLSFCDSLLTEEMYYCPPDMQRTLAYDEDNKQIRTRLAEEERARWLASSPDEDSNPKSRGKNGFTYNLPQDDNSDLVTINYSTDHATKMTALVTNALGYVYRRTDQSCAVGNGQATIDCSGLRRGQYILYINVDGEQYAEKVNLK